MNKEQLYKTIEITKEYNLDLHKKLRHINKVRGGKLKSQTEVDIEEIQDVLILTSILLSGNIKARYEIEEYIRENKAFVDLAMLKQMSSNCKDDIEALKGISFSMTAVLNSMKMQQEQELYKERNV